MVPEVVLDDHMHLSPRGDPEQAVKEFEEAGGTHVLSPNLLQSGYDLDVREGEDYRALFEAHVELVESIDSDVEIYPIVGVHPAEITRLAGRMGLEGAEVAISRGLEIASDFAEDGRAVAIGEIGRPHYDVEQKFIDAANSLMKKGFRLAAEVGCAVQLHTERMTPEKVAEIALMAEGEGLDPGRVVHHFCPPLVDECEEVGTVPSVLARRDTSEEAASKGDRFMLETDFLDDPGRPGTVLAPGTVPKRTSELLGEGFLSEESAERMHRSLPEQVYGLDL